MDRCRAVVKSHARAEPRSGSQGLRMTPGPQQRLLDEILRPLAITVAQSERVCVQRVAVLRMQRTDQLVAGHALVSHLAARPPRRLGYGLLLRGMSRTAPDAGSPCDRRHTATRPPDPFIAAATLRAVLTRRDRTSWADSMS